MKKLLVIFVLMVTISSMVQAASFTDIQGLNCEMAVESLAHLGVVNGLNESEYAPGKSVTRAELSKMIVSVMNENNSAQKNFSDIQGHWGESFIKRAGGLGILNGYTDGTFQPDKEVSYAEAVAILVRSLGYHSLENGSGKWYEQYLTKMKEIGLDVGVKSFQAEAYANRGDIAVLLWNTIKSDANGEAILIKSFPKYEYWNNKKILDITMQEGKIVYHTDDGNFFVESGIDFSDIGGLASGFLDTKNSVMLDLKIDKDRNLKKVVGNTKTVKDMGYDIFTCDDIAGYGAKEKANYVEVFINPETDKTERVVFYDTTESHFADQVKIGLSQVSIASRNVYDTSIIIHNGEMITLKILRKETVKEIDKNAIVVHDGRVVSWTEVPDDSVIREIKKDKIYTYVHHYTDVALDGKKMNTKNMTIDGKEYVFSDDCVAENVLSDVAVNFKESLTRKDLITISENDEKVRVYFNEFDEIVKFEFAYDIWKVNDNKKNEEEHKDLSKDLARVGFVKTNRYYDMSGDSDLIESRVYSSPKENSFTYKHKEGEFKIGDFVYVTSGDKKLRMVTENKKLDNIDIIRNYSGYIYDGKLGVYPVNESTEYIEVLLENDAKKEGYYSKCTMSLIDKSYFGENTQYKNMHLILDKDNTVLRVYAIRTEGVTSKNNIGIVKEIEEIESGDTVVSKNVYITTVTKSMRKYSAKLTDEYHVGDMITYEVNPSSNSKKEDSIILNEVYSHDLIGNKHDFIVQSFEKKIVTFNNINDKINFNENVFKIGSREYSFNEYIIVSATVEKNTKTGEWIFKYFTLPTGKKVTIKPNDRLVIDELTKVIVIYSGYEE